MKTMDQLKMEQAQALAALERAHAIAAAAPIPPDMVTSETSRAPWLTYKTKTLAEALAIAGAFPVVVPFESWRGTFTMLKPEELLTARETAAYSANGGPYAFSIRVDHGEHYGPRARLAFFARIDTGMVHTHVEFGAGYIGACPQLRAIVKVTRGRGDRIESKHFEANAEARAVADKVISWATGETGPIRHSAEFEYLFCADRNEPGPADAIGSHALAALRTLADRLKI